MAYDETHKNPLSADEIGPWCELCGYSGAADGINEFPAHLSFFWTGMLVSNDTVIHPQCLWGAIRGGWENWKSRPRDSVGVGKKWIPKEMLIDGYASDGTPPPTDGPETDSSGSEGDAVAVEGKE